MPRNVTRDEWVEALRSGEYQQGKGRLRRIDDGEVSHCCLGVGCDLSDPDAWQPPEASIGEEFKFEQSAWDSAGSYLPPDHVTKAIDNAADLENFTSRLTGHNDGANDLQKFDFKEIADQIEAHLPADFVLPFGDS